MLIFVNFYGAKIIKELNKWFILLINVKLLRYLFD
jgi:hypothetical protein